MKISKCIPKKDYKIKSCFKENHHSKTKRQLKMNLKVFIKFVALVAVVNGQNYCSLQNTCNGKKHVGCNNNGVSQKLIFFFNFTNNATVISIQLFSSSCDRPKLIKFTPSEKQILLEEHNWFRNAVALGELRGYATAARMARITWNDELAKLAELNVRQCQMVRAKKNC